MKLAQAGVKMGCHHCKGSLACCRVHGSGSSRDVEQALQLARESAAQGSKYGLYMMGYFIMGLGSVGPALCAKYGFKEKEEDERAAVYFRQACDLGLVEAFNELAFLLQNSNSVAKDTKEAFRLYTIAAGFGHPAANEGVGYFLLRGIGTSVDKAAAGRHLKVAAELGCVAAPRMLLECEDPSPDSSAKKVRLPLWMRVHKHVITTSHTQFCCDAAAAARA